jgi:hypothetical protein
VRVSIRPARRSRRHSGTSAQATPWTLGDFGRLIRYQVPSFIAIVACFVGARQTNSWDQQMYWVVGAMAAMLFAGASWTSWLLVGARELRQRQRRLVVVTSRFATVPEPTLTDDVTVTGRGMTHFHRPGCPLTHGRPVDTASPDEHRGRGLTPCGVCLG